MRGALDGAINEASAALRSTCRAFTGANLYHAVLRLRPEARGAWTLARFVDEALGRRLRRGPIEGLLPPPRRRPGWRPSGLARQERDACFPAAILLVDRPAIVDLFVASGALVQARVAVVCVDGSPGHVIGWLRRGMKAGHRAPVGYLHDAQTVLYPFLLEPLATLSRLERGSRIAYRDLGIGPGRPLRDPLGIARRVAAGATSLEEVPPSSLVAYACQELLRMVAPDPMLLPMTAAIGSGLQ